MLSRIVAIKASCDYSALFFGLAVLALSSCVACGGGNSTPPDGNPPPPTTRVLNLSANQVAYDSSRKLLYASVGSADSSHPNTVALIDPSTGSVTTTIPVGTDPHRLALSQDGSYLYVGTDGAGTVQRISLASKIVDETISLGSSAIGGQLLTAGDIKVMPGFSRTIAVLRGVPYRSPFYEDVAVYDEANIRPNTTPLYPTSGLSMDVLVFSGSSNTLYGLDNDSSAYAFVRMNVDANGVSVLDTTWAFLGSGYYANMVYDSGLIYSTFGSVANPSSLTKVGQLPPNPSSLTQSPFAESVLVDGGVPYLLTHLDNPIITAYDPKSYVIKADIVVKSSGSWDEDSLVTCGNSCFAFIGYSPTASWVVISTAALTPLR